MEVKFCSIPLDNPSLPCVIHTPEPSRPPLVSATSKPPGSPLVSAARLSESTLDSLSEGVVFFRKGVVFLMEGVVFLREGGFLRGEEAHPDRGSRGNPQREHRGQVCPDSFVVGLRMQGAYLYGEQRDGHGDHGRAGSPGVRLWRRAAPD